MKITFHDYKLRIENKRFIFFSNSVISDSNVSDMVSIYSKVQ